LEIQIGQVATTLKNLRENPAYATLSESFEAAQEAYETARNTANVAETNWKIVKDNLPALVQAFRVYKEAQQARIDAREASEDQFDPSTFMKGMEADLNEAKAALRADEQVDNDLDAMHPVDPAADLLAKFDAEKADAAILAEFES
jgi:hypothetical protein